MEKRNVEKIDHSISVVESMFYMCLTSISVRSLLGISYGGKYYLPFIGIALSSIAGRIIYGFIIVLNIYICLRIINVRRTLHGSVLYGLIPPFISFYFFYCQTYKFASVFLIFITICIFFVPVCEFIEKHEIAKRKKKRLRKLKVIHKLFDGPYRVYSFMAFLTLFIFSILFLFVPSFDGKRGQSANVKATTYESVSNSDFFKLLDENKEELMILKSSNFSSASDVEKLNGLQVLLNCECTYFGVEPVTLKMREMENYELGYYQSGGTSVFINPDEVRDAMDSDKCIEIVLHEGRHHLQNQCVVYAEDNNLDLSLPVYADIRAWKENINSYYEYIEDESTVSNYLTYRTQPIESDAYEFGCSMQTLISSHINDW